VAAPQTGNASSAGMSAMTGIDKVAIVDFGYAPATITVPPGTKVTWTNTGEQPHTVTALSTDPASFDSGVLNHGQTFSFTFEKPGTYDYVCTLHPFMTGKVIVDTNAPPIAK
jgi:amicyanin